MYAGEVPGLGPIRPARCRTARIAVAARTPSGAAKGAGLAGPDGVGDVAGKVRGDVVCDGPAEDGAEGRSSPPSETQALRPASVVRATTTAANRVMDRFNLGGNKPCRTSVESHEQS
jgi:hypothetical protein